MNKKMYLLILFKVVFLSPSVTCFAKNYYVNSWVGSGGDGSASSPWKNIDDVNANNTIFSSGDRILFRADRVYTGELLIVKDGGNAKIRYSRYGAGVDPIIENPNGVSCITVEANDIQIRKLILRNCLKGVRIRGRSRVQVYSCEFTDLAVGIDAWVKNSWFFVNYFHDMKMAVNTQGGDDDWGANGIVFGAGEGYTTENCAVEANLFNRLREPSLDYGFDGAAVEFYLSGNAGEIRNIFVHRNWVEKCETVFEIGGVSMAHKIGNIFFHNNHILNCPTIGVYHNSGKFGVNIGFFFFDHNTVRGSWTDGNAFYFSGTPKSAWIFRNNIFDVKNVDRIYRKSGTTHIYNLYGRETNVGGSLAAGEIKANPRFANSWTVTIPGNSPARNRGLDLSYPKDFKFNTREVPAGLPDMGAYEVQ